MQIVKWFQKCVYIVGFLYCVVCIAYTFPQNNSCLGVCAGLENSSENNSDSSDLETPSVENLFNITSLRFATPCETPNHEVSFCLEISACPVLDAVKGKKKYADYVEASKCGPKNENANDFRVCCGKYNNFINFSETENTEERRAKHITINDLDILPKECGTQKMVVRGRIIGGIEAALGEFPWMARVIHKNNYGQKSYGCAGFIIHTKYIITAAHCIRSKFSEVRGDPYSVLLGDHNVTSKRDCSQKGTYCADPPQISRIDTIIVHENYSETSKNHYNDIAIIHLRKGIKFSDYVRPICLLTEEDPLVNKYFISGWGKTETVETSPVKLKIDLDPFDIDLCREKFQMLDLDISESQICAGGQKLKDSCNGDSGGPLMIRNETNNYYFAAGLVSYGVGCGLEGWPGIYTSIPHYVEWIKKKIVVIGTKSPKPGKKNKTKKIMLPPT